MTKIVFIIAVAFMLSGCGRKNTEQTRDRADSAVFADTSDIDTSDTATVIDTLSARDNYDFLSDSNYIACDTAGTRASLILRLIKESIRAKVGDKLVLNTFEKRWDRSYLYNGGDAPQSNVWLNDISGNYYLQYDSNKTGEKRIGSKCFHKLFDIKPTSPQNIFKGNLADSSFGVIAINVAEHPNYTLYSIATHHINMCDSCEYGFGIKIQSLITVSGDKIIDDLIVRYGIGNSIGYESQNFFYDYDKKRVHIKQFYSDELEGNFIGYLIYQITPQGKFIRLKTTP